MKYVDDVAGGRTPEVLRFDANAPKNGREEGGMKGLGKRMGGENSSDTIKWRTAGQLKSMQSYPITICCCQSSIRGDDPDAVMSVIMLTPGDREPSRWLVFITCCILSYTIWSGAQWMH